MKRITSVFFVAILLLSFFAGCVSGGPDNTTSAPTTAATTTNITEPTPRGETKIFERDDLKLEITNVADVRSEWYPFDHSDGTLEEVVIYTLYPGAWLTFLNSEIAYDGWVISMYTPGEDGYPPSYIPITSNMPPMELTPDVLSIGNVLRFEWAEETQS